MRQGTAVHLPAAGQAGPAGSAAADVAHQNHLQIVPAAELMTFPNRQHPACASSTLSETTSKLSCLFLDVFDESRDVQPVGQRVMEIDEER
jgi:hypothetical protein